MPWQPYGRSVTVPALLNLLLLAAALRASLSALVRRFSCGFSHETARQALYACLPPLQQLTDGLVDALHAFGGRAWRRRRWDIAVDLHYCPFYGQRHTADIVGGPHKQGTKYFYAYATAVLLHRRQRYTVGLIPVCGSQQPHLVLQALLEQLQARGLRLRGVALDSGFDSAEVLRLLQKRKLWYVLPLRRKGRGTNARNAWFERPAGEVFTASWQAEKSRRRVRTRAVVGRRPHDGKVMLYAFAGWTRGAARSKAAQARQVKQARRKYRARYGIETSYRQLNEGKARTTAKDVRYRLLLVGLALLLRQAWVWLTRQLAQAQGRGLAEWVAELPLQRVLDWLQEAIKADYTERRALELSSPLLFPEGLAA